MSNRFQDLYFTWQAKRLDPQQYAKVYDLYIDKIYRFVYFKVSDKEIAQDLSAEAFLKTWEYLNSGKEIDNIKALLYRVARNLVIDHYRSKQRSDISLEQDILEMATDEESNEPETLTHIHIDAKLELERVEQAIRCLKDEYKDILLLKHIEDLSISEIAKILEKKNGAVRVTLHRAQKALQQVLDQRS